MRATARSGGALVAAMILGIFAGATGCHQVPVQIVDSAVEPGPSTIFAGTTWGGLQVFSGYDPNPNTSIYVKSQENSAYEIRTLGGAMVRVVPNRYGLTAQDGPTVISLPPGKYYVTGWFRKSGFGKVPVLILRGRLTTVQL